MRDYARCTKVCEHNIPFKGRNLGRERCKGHPRMISRAEQSRRKMYKRYWGTMDGYENRRTYRKRTP